MVYTSIIVTTVTIILVLVPLRELLRDLALVSPFRSLSSDLTSKAHVSVIPLLVPTYIGRGLDSAAHVPDISPLVKLQSLR